MSAILQFAPKTKTPKKATSEAPRKAPTKAAKATEEARYEYERAKGQVERAKEAMGLAALVEAFGRKREGGMPTRTAQEFLKQRFPGIRWSWDTVEYISMGYMNPRK